MIEYIYNLICEQFVLRRQQDMELAESALMDEMREAEERSRREAEELVKQKIEAEELQAAATAQSLYSFIIIRTFNTGNEFISEMSSR